MSIIYPKGLEKGQKICIVAPSDGVKDQLDIKRFENGVSKLQERDYEVVYGSNVLCGDGKGRSNTAKARGEELMKAIADKDISGIISAKGGDFLCEILPMVDYEVVKNNPKWFQGYSDNTGLCFSITTLTDVATIYGNNFGAFGMDIWHRAVEENLRILKNEEFVQESFQFYEDSFHDKVTGLEGFAEDKKVAYKGYKGFEAVDSLELKGRLIGGCTDVIGDIAGTPYEDYKGFKERYGKEGIIFYLESFNGNSEQTVRTLWKLREMGWFEGISGILFGRPMFESSDYGISYEEAVTEVIGPLNISYVFGCDIGHKQPQFSMVNGAMGTFRLKGDKGSIEISFS